MMAIGAVAQVTVTIGEGTTKGHVVPVNTYFNYSLTQQIYTADEIGMAGPISSVAFYFDYTSSFSFEGIQLYMMHTTKSSFASNTDMVALDDAVLVYEGVFGATTAGWITLPLTTTFDYNGTDNLLICMYDPTYGYATSSHDFRYTSTSGSYTSIAYYSDSYTPSLDDVSSFSGTKTYNQYHNNIQLGITPSGAVCMKPTAVTVNNITAHEATVSWTAGYDETVWQICVDNDEEHLFEANSNSYNLDGLTADASHTVKVRSACEGGEFSGWTANTSFRTLVSCPAPTALTCTGVTATTATLSWTLGASETAWQICLDNDEEHLIDVDANPFTLEGLTAETAHTAKVRAVCGVDDVSAWTAVCNFEPTAKILIGSVTSTSSYLPSHSNYNYSLTQQIYTATEIGGAYNFSSIDFYNAGSTKTRNFDVYLVNTDKASFDSNSDWITVTENDKVFSGSVVMTAGVWTTITFTSDFYYDGVSNLAVIVDDNTGSYSSGMSCRVFTATGQAIYNYSDGTNYNPLSPSGSGTVSNLKNQIRLLGTPAEAPACVKPTTLTATNITARTADLTWVAGADETAWQICLDNDEEHIIDVDAASYAFEGLTPEHTYYVKVRSVCGTSDYSEWTSNISFTTLVSCPVPTALTCTGITATTATLSWTAGASEGEWNLRYKAAADADWSVENDVTSPYTITGLTAETDYEVQVQAVCGVDDLSAWTSSAHVYTGYCQPAPTSRDGKGITGVSFGIGDDVVNNSNDNGLPEATPYYGNYANLVGAVMAGVEATVNITYYTSGGYSSYGYGTIIWIDLNNNLIFDGDEVVYVGESAAESPTTLAATFTLPASTPTGDYRMRIAAADSYYDSFTSSIDAAAAANPCPTGSYTVVHDYTLRVLETPSCVPPTALSASNISNESATLTWTAGADETAWQICINNDEDELINVTETSYTLNDLTAATTYSVKVRANCGDNDNSEWTSAIVFATELCAAENQCQISYAFSDQYDDGWDGSVINVLDAETNELLASWTCEDGESSTGSLALCNGRQIKFVWVNGGSYYNYDYEASYAVYDVNGDEIFSGEGAMASPVNYTVNCSTCKKPSALEANNVTTESAELTWTAGNAETAWQICVNGDEENLINVTETTYTLANLDEETDYTVKVRANCGEEQSGWVEESFTTLASCPDPVDMEVTATTNTTANISWDGTVDSYVVRYAPGTIVLSADFENGMPNGWTAIDADGDGYDWVAATEAAGVYFVEGTDLSGSGNNLSQDYLISGSYSNISGALTPDNWIVTPAIELPSEASLIHLQFYASGQDANYANEHYGVYVSTTTTDPSAFTMLWAETMDAEGGPHRVQGVWGEKNTDLTAYAGQTVYIALRHFNTSDQFCLNVDDFVVYAVMPEDWEEATTTETSIELTNLNANTAYLYMMNGVCDGAANGTWTPVHTFTTEPNTYTITATAGDNGTISPAAETVVEGEDLEITIEAATGYRIESVVVDGGTEAETNVTAQLIDGVYTFVNVTADHTIHATFVAVPEGEFVVTVNATENGTITPNGIQTVAENGDFTFTVTPNDCYGVAEVTVNGVEVTLDENNQYTASVTEDLTINAVFEMLTYTITATAGDNGTISPDNAVVNCGGEQVFTITPAAGYRIAAVVVDAETEGAANVTNDVVAGDEAFFYTFENVTANHTINATFELIPTYTITVNAGENGNVYYNDALVSAPVVVTEGATPEFEITPATGYQIDVLTVGGNTIELTEQQLGGFTYTFEPVRADITLTVTFEAIPANTHTITLIVGEHGTVTASDEDDNEIAIENGVITVNDGEDVYLEFTPEENYRIDEIIVNGVSIELEEEDLEGFIYPMFFVSDDYTVSVTFTRLNAADMINAGSMAIYPNPNNGMFSIDFSNINGDATYQLIDARGAVVETRDINVMSGETMNFNHDLRPGTYFVRIINGDKVYVEQIVVE